MGEPDPASLMASQVHDHALSFLGDLAKGEVELGTAVAAQRPEDVAGEALAVDADKDAARARHLAGHEREVVLAVDEREVGVPGERAIGRRDAGSSDPLDELLLPPAPADEVGDGDDRQAVGRREALELGQAGHRLLVLAHDLAKHAGRSDAREAG